MGTRGFHHAAGARGRALAGGVTVEDREIRSGHAAYVQTARCAGRAGLLAGLCCRQRMSPAPRLASGESSEGHGDERAAGDMRCLQHGPARQIRAASAPAVARRQRGRF